MKGSILSGTLWCARGSGDGERIVGVFVRLRVRPVHPSEGRGYEVDLLEAMVGGEDFALTDEEVDRALERFTEEKHHAD